MKPAFAALAALFLAATAGRSGAFAQDLDVPDWLAVLPAPPATAATPAFTWPVRGAVTQPFGCTGLELERPAADCPNGYHLGLDIAEPTGVPVAAAAAGTAYGFPDHGGRYGSFVLVQHPDGFATVYGHLSRIDVGWRETITAGRVIGLVGSTGNSTGPHLHFEIRHGGVALDPAPFLAGSPPPLGVLPDGWPGSLPNDQRRRR